MPRNLIALVVVSLIVDNERVEIQPGETLPDISDHDYQALKSMGSIEDQDEKAAEEKKQAAKDRKAGTEFQNERKKVQAAAASTTAPPAPPDK